MDTEGKQGIEAYQGKTYSLYGNSVASDGYYRAVRRLTDRLLKHCPDEENLLYQIQMAGSGRRWRIRSGERRPDRSLVRFVKQTLRENLSEYTSGVETHLRTLPFRKRFDPVLRTKEYQYHLFMVEIELVNRIYREAFKSSKYRFALIAHCLRDFRPGCLFEPAEMEATCGHCTEECFINLGSMLLKEFDIHPYISLTTDLETLFLKIKSEHPGVGALGIACVPELALGMRLCVKLGIPPVGIPLDANRCARWMNEAHESSFSLRELNDLLE
jgi:hypothetical protein